MNTSIHRKVRKQGFWQRLWDVLDQLDCSEADITCQQAQILQERQTYLEDTFWI